MFAIAIAQAVGIVLLLSGFGPTLLGSVLALAAASGMAVAPGIAAVGIYFGRRSFGAIIVTAFFVEDVASNGLLPLAGYSTSISVGYVPMFVGAAVVSLVGAVLFWMLGHPRLAPSQARGVRLPVELRHHFFGEQGEGFGRRRIREDDAEIANAEFDVFVDAVGDLLRGSG